MQPAVTAVASEPALKPGVVPRVASIDAFRGLVMTLMVAEVMRLWTVAKAYPRNHFWAFVAFHTTHVPWQGCSLHDLIQPGFSFLVGASLPFSIASRKARGQSFGYMLRHAASRSLVLIFLGIFLRSLGHKHTYWTFEDTLTQIGLGYVFLFLLAFVSMRMQVVTFAAIVVGFWGLFALYPVPGPAFDYAQVGVPSDWGHLYTGFLAHWNKNSNVAWRFDVWFLNLFPRESPFRFNDGGWSTLSFIPTLATMLVGLLAGLWLKTSRTAFEKVRGLLAAGFGLALLGLLFQWLHVCPIVKRVWTSSYTLYSGGLILLILAGFYALMELRGWKTWAYPLIVVGANSIAIYVMSWTMEQFFSAALPRHLGAAPFAWLGPPFEPVLLGLAVMLVFWLILLWMYRRKIFVRI